ncbi:olfactory receptor 5AP2-like [Ambystoma mexicanum]|uniref:olfactory receptor 5AP2-like n=1 Tax=Ambystoma mexicanum TaxID=8296 RepID=UPI0037E8A340
MKNSYQRNQTTEFLLLGLSDNPKVQTFLFLLFLVFYMITLAGDLFIMLLVALDPKLHNPMYLFLANFSFVDICLISAIVPQFLRNLISTRQTISFVGCLTQFFFFGVMANAECLLLAVMGYDRYVAIYSPLNYSLVMSSKTCGMLVAAAYVISVLHSLLYTLMSSQLSFCGSNKIHHFFCDFPPLLKLSCSDTSIEQLVVSTEGMAMLLVPFLFLVASYTTVVRTILKSRSVEGRWKAFSTCSSHLTVVALYYSSLLFMYFKPLSSYSLDYDRVVSVVYSAIVPMLNPFIYSLRNKDIARASRRVLNRWIMHTR